MTTERNLIARFSNIFLIGLAVFFSLFHIYLGINGMLETYLQRSLHLFMGLMIIFLGGVVSANNKVHQWTNVLFALATLALSILIFSDYTTIASDRIPYATPLTAMLKGLAIISILLLLEATRRAAGLFFTALTAVFIVYVFVGPYLPGIFYHGGTTLALLLDGAFYTTDGVFGIPIGAASTYVVLFVIFGAFLEKSGIGELIMDVSIGIFGRFRGGPAKAAVISSGAFGSIDGNATADVMVTGSVNIPLMKKMGYSPNFAAGVESAAASGGVLLPPVMGTVAFLMADYTGIPYSQIMIYALIPALLYYVGVFSMVHFQSVRMGMGSVKKEDMPQWTKTLKAKWHLLLPIVLLVALIVNHYSPMYAVAYSIISIVIVANLRKNTRMGPKVILDALIIGAKGSVVVTMATAAAGLMIYIFSVTGIGLRFTSNLVDLSNGILFVALLLTMCATILLGMGVPPSAAYIIQVAITIPPIISILRDSGYSGDALVAAHMFVMYYASMAVITPPVALAAYAASGIANSNPLKTGLIATQLAFTAFVVPFIFVYNPEYLMMGAWYENLLALLTGAVAIAGISGVIMGYFIIKLNWSERLLLLIGSVCMMWTTLLFNAVGVTLVVLVMLLQMWRRRSASSNTTLQSPSL